MVYIPGGRGYFDEFEQQPVPARANASGAIAIVSFILGGVSLLVAWIPYLGILAIPVSALGAVLGFVGIVVGRAAGQRRVFLPFFAMLLCGVSVAVSYASTYAWQHREGAPGQTKPVNLPPPIDMTGVSGPFKPKPMTQPTFVMPRFNRRRRNRRRRRMWSGRRWARSRSAMPERRAFCRSVTMTDRRHPEVLRRISNVERGSKSEILRRTSG